MKQITTFLSILAMLICLACASDGKDGSDSPAVKDGRDDMPANVIDCSAGDHDTDGDGRRDYTMECYENGNRKREIVLPSRRHDKRL